MGIEASPLVLQLLVPRARHAAAKPKANEAVPKTDYRGEDLRNNTSSFSHKDLSGYDFRGAQLDGTNFYKSFLHKANFSSITIENELLNLEKGAARVKNNGVWDIESPEWDSTGDCKYNEVYNLRTIGRMFWRGTRKGIVLFHGGKPVGFIKFKGDKSFLAMRTVRDENGNVIFWKGMIYALDYGLIKHLLNKSDAHERRRQWRRADLETAMLQMKDSGQIPTGYRFIRTSHRFVAKKKLYGKLTRLTKRIENGKEPMIDILA